jgi:phosphoribosylanthranilate isomerase
MRRPYVKVCGVTRVEDALAAVAAGADAIGFVLVPGSPRRVTPEAAAEIAARLPLGIARVGVTADLDPAEARAMSRTIGLTAIQAHGDETPDACRAYGLPVVKALAAGSGFDPAVLDPYREFPVLLDGYASAARGGTGRIADWSAARRAVEAGFRVLLAGGLSPGNLRAAVEAVGPRAVDLNSGVESRPGVKDPGLVRRALALLADLDPPEEDAWPW